MFCVLFHTWITSWLWFAWMDWQRPFFSPFLLSRVLHEYSRPFFFCNGKKKLLSRPRLHPSFGSRALCQCCNSLLLISQSEGEIKSERARRDIALIRFSLTHDVTALVESHKNSTSKHSPCFLLCTAREKVYEGWERCQTSWFWTKCAKETHRSLSRTW